MPACNHLVPSNAAVTWVLCISAVTFTMLAQHAGAVVATDQHGNIHISAAPAAHSRTMRRSNNTVASASIADAGNLMPVYINGRAFDAVVEVVSKYVEKQMETPLQPQLVAVGGYDGQDRLATVEQIGQSLDGWASAPSMVFGRTAFGMAPFQGKLVVVGGYGTSGYLRSVEMFDGKRWRLSADMPSRRDGLGVAVLGDVLYAIGGFNGRFQAKVERFNGSTWSTDVPALPQARTTLCTITFDDRIYAIGGFSGTYSDRVDVFDGSGWAVAPSMPTARSTMGCAVHNNRVFVVGGFNGEYLDTVESFDGNSWQPEADLHTARRWVAAGSFSGLLLAVGGIDGPTTFLTTVEVFNGTSWTSGVELTQPKGWLALSVYP